ncbi:MAG: M42 family metallopeptidase [Romboutsia sp.]|uniref:M42 family metallopeptidase n=1 Tax=Romboutsia sp. TaxID=1965302 RepID=UPI003F34D694
MDNNLEMLKKLTEADGTPANEKEVRTIMKEYIKDYADEVYTDKLGSLIAKKVGKKDGPRIMVAGHMDEIGFMVTRIDENGFLSFQPLGGWSTGVMGAQKVTITTSRGNKFMGIINTTPSFVLSPEQKSKQANMKDMYIDLGVNCKVEAEMLGIRPGDMVTPYFEFSTMANPKYLVAKAWDNRVGCAIAIDVMKNLKNENHPNEVYSVGTVQEEVGCRGGKTSSHVVKPDIGISIDVGMAADTPGISKKDAIGDLGRGPQINIYDGSMVGHTDLRNFVVNVAEELKIPYQYAYIPFGGTDAGPMHTTLEGAPCIYIGIATRYIHSHAGIIHRDDYDNAVKLITEIVKRLDNDTVKLIIEGEE